MAGAYGRSVSWPPLGPGGGRAGRGVWSGYSRQWHAALGRLSADLRRVLVCAVAGWLGESAHLNWFRCVDSPAVPGVGMAF
jgi:hypothetical protein